MKHLLFFTTLLIAVSTSKAQQQATTTDGQRVILHEDGTWEYAREDTAAPVRVPPSSESKDDCEYDRNEVDSFTNEVTQFTKPVRAARGHRGRLSFSLARVGGEAAVIAQYSSDLGCIAQGRSKLLIKTESEQVLEMIHQGKTRCGDNESLMARLQDDDLEILLTAPIKELRLHGTDYYVDLEPSDKGARYFIDNYKCIDD